MGKIKQGKRLSSHRSSIDPLGGKMPLADEIESLRLAKSKSTDQANNSSTRKRQADEDEFVNEKMTAKILKLCTTFFFSLSIFFIVFLKFEKL